VGFDMGFSRFVDAINLFEVSFSQWMETTSLFLFALQCILIFLLSFFLFCSIKYIRAFFKRISLKMRIKRVCRRRGYSYKIKASYYASVFFITDGAEIEVKTDDEIIAVKFFPCLIKRHTYTIKSEGGFYTRNNFNPIVVLRSRIGLSRILFRPKNDFVIHVNDDSGIPTELDTAKKNILCLHPIPVNVNVVRTNREEQTFNGDKFLGYTVYSGSGLIDFLEGNNK
jgi:hypothetical protein